MTDFTAIDGYIHEHMEDSVAELMRLVAQPSVAAQNRGIHECASLVSGMLQKRGFAVQLLPTGGSPVVYGERKGKSDKTLLLYCHYDVQPPEPLELWESPPFEPAVRDGKIYGRGVSDDKSQIANHLLTIDALLAANGELPCNVKFIIEGEEEIGSVHLYDFVREHAGLLAGDACIWEVGGVDHTDAFIEYLGLRGICYVELSVATANQDVHSGLGGSILNNAAWRLVWALNSLKGPDERIRIPGYYDNVRPPTPRQVELMKALPEVAEEYKQRYGIKGFLKGTKGGIELRIQEVFEPTCTICGLTSGYQGEGVKTVLPARASAKVDFRLVPDQTPDEVVKKLRAHLDAQGFADVQVTPKGGEAPAVTDPDDPFVKLVLDTARPVYSDPIRVVPLIGGSGPNAAFVDFLKVPIVTAGCSYPGTQAHAPNENVRLDLYEKAARHCARIMEAFGNSLNT